MGRVVAGSGTHAATTAAANVAAQKTAQFHDYGLKSYVENVRIATLFEAVQPQSSELYPRNSNSRSGSNTAFQGCRVRESSAHAAWGISASRCG
jgi:hypothetical protein